MIKSSKFLSYRQFNTKAESLEVMTRAMNYVDISAIPIATYLLDGELVELNRQNINKQAGWLASHFVVKELAQDYLASMHHVRVKNLDIIVVHGKLGQPELSSGNQKLWPHLQNVAVSLSHAGQFGASAITSKQQAVGVDIERIQTFNPATLKAFLSQEESASILRDVSNKQDLRATLSWSYKEAYLKAKGCGLRQHPNTLTLDFLPDFSMKTIYDHNRPIMCSADWQRIDRQHIMTTVTFLLPSYVTKKH